MNKTFPNRLILQWIPKKLVSWRLRNIRILLKETFLETFPAEFMKHDAKFYNAEEAILALVIILQEESSS